MALNVRPIPMMSAFYRGGCRTRAKSSRWPTGAVTDRENHGLSRVSAQRPKMPTMSASLQHRRQTVRAMKLCKAHGRSTANAPPAEGVLDGLSRSLVRGCVIHRSRDAVLKNVSLPSGSARHSRRIRASHLGPEGDDPYLSSAGARCRIQATAPPIASSWHNTDRVVQLGTARIENARRTQRRVDHVGLCPASARSAACWYAPD